MATARREAEEVRRRRRAGRPARGRARRLLGKFAVAPPAASEHTGRAGDDDRATLARHRLRTRPVPAVATTAAPATGPPARSPLALDDGRNVGGVKLRDQAVINVLVVRDGAWSPTSTTPTTCTRAAPLGPDVVVARMRALLRRRPTECAAGEEALRRGSPLRHLAGAGYDRARPSARDDERPAKRDEPCAKRGAGAWAPAARASPRRLRAPRRLEYEIRSATPRGR